MDNDAKEPKKPDTEVKALPPNMQKAYEFIFDLLDRLEEEETSNQQTRVEKKGKIN